MLREFTFCCFEKKKPVGLYQRAFKYLFLNLYYCSLCALDAAEDCDEAFLLLQQALALELPEQFFFTEDEPWHDLFSFAGASASIEVLTGWASALIVSEGETLTNSFLSESKRTALEVSFPEVQHFET
ncbi:MAG: hypothetical protein EA409_03930 [Saprospirales bacterium]|nr:MAG: hypothetical protein EA409_03930 [Saprospirales bacterium]